LKTGSDFIGRIKKDSFKIKIDQSYKQDLNILETIYKGRRKMLIQEQKTGELFKLSELGKRYKETPSRKIKGKTEIDILKKENLEKGIFSMTAREYTFKDLIKAGYRKESIKIKKGGEHKK